MSLEDRIAELNRQHNEAKCRLHNLRRQNGLVYTVASLDKFEILVYTTHSTIIGIFKVEYSK